MCAYRRQPEEYLTKIACRKALAGDANLILKIHEFLERRGVINFYFSPHGQEHFESSFKPRVPRPSLCKARPPSPAREAESDLLFNSIKLLSKNLRPFCEQCGLSCGLCWFSEPGRVRAVLCAGCVEALPRGEAEHYAKQDFTSKPTPDARGQSRNPWTVEETVRLLDLLAEDLSWEQVKESLGKKRTKEEIILHFLQLPCQNFRPAPQPAPTLTWAGLTAPILDRRAQARREADPDLAQHSNAADSWAQLLATSIRRVTDWTASVVAESQASNWQRATARLNGPPRKLNR